MHQQIAGQQNRDGGGDRQVAPVAARDHLARHDQQECSGERQIDRRRRPGTDDGAEPHGHPSSSPQADERPQRPTPNRQSSGPIGNCGQQEARDYRRNESVDHLVDVPVDEAERRWRFRMAQEHRDPQRHRKRGPEGGDQEERPKAEGQNGWWHGGFPFGAEWEQRPYAIGLPESARPMMARRSTLRASAQTS